MTMRRGENPLDFALIVSDLDAQHMVAWEHKTQRVLLYGTNRYIAMRATHYDEQLGWVAMIDHKSWCLLSSADVTDLTSLYLAPRNWSLVEAMVIAEEPVHEDDIDVLVAEDEQ